jgi:hypothetical protein
MFRYRLNHVACLKSGDAQGNYRAQVSLSCSSRQERVHILSACPSSGSFALLGVGFAEPLGNLASGHVSYVNTLERITT